MSENFEPIINNEAEDEGTVTILPMPEDHQEVLVEPTPVLDSAE